MKLAVNLSEVNVNAHCKRLELRRIQEALKNETPVVPIKCDKKPSARWMGDIVSEKYSNDNDVESFDGPWNRSFSITAAPSKWR